MAVSPLLIILAPAGLSVVVLAITDTDGNGQRRNAMCVIERWSGHWMLRFVETLISSADVLRCYASHNKRSKHAVLDWIQDDYGQYSSTPGRYQRRHGVAVIWFWSWDAMTYNDGITISQIRGRARTTLFRFDVLVATKLPFERYHALISVKPATPYTLMLVVLCQPTISEKNKKHLTNFITNTYDDDLTYQILDGLLCGYMLWTGANFVVWLRLRCALKNTMCTAETLQAENFLPEKCPGDLLYYVQLRLYLLPLKLPASVDKTPPV